MWAHVSGDWDACVGPVQGDTQRLAGANSGYQVNVSMGSREG